jgi:hypothetical protein
MTSLPVSPSLHGWSGNRPQYAAVQDRPSRTVTIGLRDDVVLATGRPQLI